MLAKALVRRFESLLKGLDVKPIVAAADCLPRRSQHPLKLSLERIQVSLGQFSVAIDCPLQPPRPGPIDIIHYGVENLLALGIEELGRDPLPGIVHRPLATVPGAVARRGGLVDGRVQARSSWRTGRFKMNRPGVMIRGVDLSRIGLRAACMRAEIMMVSV